MSVNIYMLWLRYPRGLVMGKAQNMRLCIHNNPVPLLILLLVLSAFGEWNAIPGVEMILAVNTQVYMRAETMDVQYSLWNNICLHVNIH